MRRWLSPVPGGGLHRAVAEVCVGYKEIRGEQKVPEGFAVLVPFSLPVVSHDAFVVFPSGADF